jgi:plastocyanin
VRYASSDPVLAPIHSFSGAITSKRLGRATYTAEATIYGTKWRDSVEFEFDWPAVGWAVAQNQAAPDEAPRVTFDPAVVRIGAGGTVLFSNFTTVALEVVFDDPTHVEERTTFGCPYFPDQGGGGNIASFGGGVPNPWLNCRSRRFPVPGVYTYRITPDGPTRTIIVEESAL